MVVLLIVVATAGAEESPYEALAAAVQAVDLGEGEDRSAAVAKFADAVKTLVKERDGGGAGLEKLFDQLVGQVNKRAGNNAKTNAKTKVQHKSGAKIAKNGWFHRATWMQPAKAVQSSLASIHTVLFSLSNFLTEVACPSHFMQSTVSCEGVSFASMGNGRRRKKKQWAARKKKARSFEDMFENIDYMSTSSWNKHKPLSYYGGREEKTELGGGRDEMPVAAEKTTSTIQGFEKAIVETIHEGMQRNLGEGKEDSMAWGRDKAKGRGAREKARTKMFGKRGFLKGLLTKGGKKLIAKIAAKYLMKLTGYNQRTYTCLCKTYIKPYLTTGQILGCAPSFTKRDQRHWLTREPAKNILFSILKAPKKEHVDLGRHGIKTKLAICKYDAAVSLLECRKHKQYRSICDKRYAPGAVLRDKHRGVATTCSNRASDKKVFGKGLQCRPNKASCGGGMLKRAIAVQLDPQHPGSKTEECKRALLPVDALLRFAIGPIASINVELFQAQICRAQDEAKRL